MNITIPTEDSATTPHYRLGKTMLYGTPFHVECIAVKDEDVGSLHGYVRKALAPEFQSRVDAIENEMQETLQTVKFPGDDRDWFILITPFGA